MLDATEASKPTPAPARSALASRIVPPTVDGRSRGAKRLTELVHQLAAHVDDPSDPVARALLMDAAHLTMQSEALAHRAATGDLVDADQAVRVSGALGRALDRLAEHRERKA